MKKAQIEIMGLVMIVILLVLIAVFALSFMLKPKQESNDILKIKANALRSSLLKTSLCGSVTLKDEIENCIDGYNECIECRSLRQEIINMIKGSLENNEKYNFIVHEDEGGDFININNCVNNITAVSQNLRNGNVNLMICGG